MPSLACRRRGPPDNPDPSTWDPKRYTGLRSHFLNAIAPALRIGQDAITPSSSPLRRLAKIRRACIGDRKWFSLSINDLPCPPKTSFTCTERSVKFEAGNRVRRANTPGSKRTPQVTIRFSRDTSAKRERGPTKQHHVRIDPLSLREITKIRFGFASGMTRARPVPKHFAALRSSRRS